MARRAKKKTPDEGGLERSERLQEPGFELGLSKHIGDAHLIPRCGRGIAPTGLTSYRGWHIGFDYLSIGSSELLHNAGLLPRFKLLLQSLTIGTIAYGVRWSKERDSNPHDPPIERAS